MEKPARFYVEINSQPFYRPGKDPQAAQSLPAIVDGLLRSRLARPIAQSQAGAFDKDYAAQHTPVVDPRLVMVYGKERCQLLHLNFFQPEKIAHRTPGSANS